MPVTKVASKLKPRLSQQMIRDYQQLQANFELLEARFKDSKEHMIELLKDVELVQESGPLCMELNEIETHRPKWKEEFVAVAGEDAAKEVIKQTSVTIINKLTVKVRPSLVIE